MTEEEKLIFLREFVSWIISRIPGLNSAQDDDGEAIVEPDIKTMRLLDDECERFLEKRRPR